MVQLVRLLIEPRIGPGILPIEPCIEPRIEPRILVIEPHINLRILLIEPLIHLHFQFSLTSGNAIKFAAHSHPEHGELNPKPVPPFKSVYTRVQG